MSLILICRRCCAAAVLAVPVLSVAAVTCVANKATGKFEAADQVTASSDACVLRANDDMLVSFQDARTRVQASGTRVYGGVFVTNASGLASRQEPGPPLLLNSSASTPTIQPQIPLDVGPWEILDSDGSLQKTVARWAAVSGWEVHWRDVPEIGNPGYVKLPAEDFLSAVDYVFLRVKSASKAAGFDLQITAYPNRVLVISKEDSK